jgi:hypothetical protein
MNGDELAYPLIFWLTRPPEIIIFAYKKANMRDGSTFPPHLSRKDSLVSVRSAHVG